MSGNFCDLHDLNKIALDDTTLISKCIPKDVVSRDVQQKLALSHISQSPHVDSGTAITMIGMFKSLKFYQDCKHARKGSTSKGFSRLSCDHHTTGFNNRPDINNADPTKLPIMDYTLENAQEMKKLKAAIVRFLVEILCMDPDDEKYLKYYEFLWLQMSGMGGHGDYAGEEDKNLFFLRIIISFGQPRKVHFTVHSFGDSYNETKATKKEYNLLTIECEGHCHCYTTSPFGSGRIPLCYYKASSETRGLQVKHEVERIGADGDAAINIIIDFPLRTLEGLMEAMAIMKSFPVVLPFDGCTEEYNKLLLEVTKQRKQWRK